MLSEKSNGERRTDVDKPARNDVDPSSSVSKPGTRIPTPAVQAADKIENYNIPYNTSIA